MSAAADLDTLARLHAGGQPVAVYRSGHGLDPVLAPRPFLHPVTTLGGVPVSDAEPEDHRWHLGVSVAVQDVAGSNLWGGRTYVRDHGYQWRDDHGHMRHGTWVRRAPGTLVHELDWIGHDGVALVREVRSLHATTTPGVAGWTLDWSSQLAPAGSAPVALGSPGTNGRQDAGYGGFFWRLPRRAPVAVWTPDGEGEAQVHGAPAPWLAVGGGAPDGPDTYTLLFAAGDPRTAQDPWFVRVDGYPGVGSALAFDEVLTLEPGATTEVRVRVHVVDGRLDRAAAAAVHAQLTAADRPAGDGRDLHS